MIILWSFSHNQPQQKEEEEEEEQAFRWFDKECVDSPASCWWGGLPAQKGR